MTSATTDQTFSPALRRAVVVTTLGSFLAFLDSTIVNVALETLSAELDAPIASIQWVVTGYLLAAAAVIPVSGWAATRFGPAQAYTATMVVFTLSSVVCGLAGSLGLLVAGRVLQGVAGGLMIPISTVLIMRAARPEQITRVMAVTGIPTVMAPVFGPTVGGLLLDRAGWQWIFFVNVPIGVLTVVLALRLLTFTRPEPAGRLDLTGLALITAGSVAITYGLAEIGSAGRISATTIWTVTLGALLLVTFVIHQLRSPAPLLDLRLFRNLVYGAASVTNFCLGAVIFGAIILMPLYFQLVRGEDAVSTGLLLMPQGVGVALGMFAGAGLTDRIGAGRTALSGGLLCILATLPFTALSTGTSYWTTSFIMLGRGIGLGLCMVSVMSATYRAIAANQVSDATVQLNVLQRLGGSIATAGFTVVLQRRLDTAATLDAVADGFGTAFWWVVVISVGLAAPVLLLIRAERATGKESRR